MKSFTMASDTKDAMKKLSCYRATKYLGPVHKTVCWLGVDLGRAILCNWAMQEALASVPLINLIQDEILASRVVNIDETTVQVLAKPGRAPTSTSCMWLLRRGYPYRPALIYQYHPTRAGDVAREFLGDFRPDRPLL